MSRQATTCRVTLKTKPSAIWLMLSLQCGHSSEWSVKWALSFSNSNIYFMAAVSGAGSAVKKSNELDAKIKYKKRNIMRHQTALRHEAVESFPLFIRDKEQYKILNISLNSKSRQRGCLQKHDCCWTQLQKHLSILLTSAVCFQSIFITKWFLQWPLIQWPEQEVMTVKFQCCLNINYC